MIINKLFKRNLTNNKPKHKKEITKLNYPGLYEQIKLKKLNNEELSFCFITPNSLARGLEGPIISRLLSSTSSSINNNTNGDDIMLVGSRMFRPSNEFVDDYIDAHTNTHQPAPFIPFIEFLNRELRPNENRKYPNAILMLLFTGKNVRNKLVEIIGTKDHHEQLIKATLPSFDRVEPITTQSGTFIKNDNLNDLNEIGLAKSIRGSFGKILLNKDQKIVFEPAIVAAHNDEANKEYLKIISKYSEIDGGTLLKVNELNEYEKDKVGMVMVKPESLDKSARLGFIMNLFSSTGLQLIGTSVFSMSYKQADEFYGFLLNIFEKKFESKIKNKLKNAIDNEFEFNVDDEFYDITTKLLQKKFAYDEVHKIIEYITGEQGLRDSSNIEFINSVNNKRGQARLFCLLYYGKDAIKTIREKLGDTNPNDASSGTVRAEFGSDVKK